MSAKFSHALYRTLSPKTPLSTASIARRRRTPWISPGKVQGNREIAKMLARSFDLEETDIQVMPVASAAMIL